jgi:hypothetical protein
LNAQSRLRAETSADWLPLTAFPEFAADLAPRAPSYPPPPAPLPPYHTVPALPATNSLAVAGFVCGLIGLIPCCCGILSIAGLVMSCIALSQLNRNPAQGGRSLAIAGIVLSILGLLVLAVLTIISAMNPNPQGFDQILKNLK